MAEEVKKKQSNIALTVLIVGAILFGAAAMSAATLALINSQNSNKKVYTASYLASEVVKKMNYENLSEISPSDISNYYDIPEGVVTDSAMFVSTRSDSYTEIACFKLKSNESEKQLTKSIDNYISAKKKTYQNVDDKAYAVVSAAKTDVHYPYVIVVISPDSDAAVSTFESIVSNTGQASV